jgi:uncharacterized protein
MAVGDREGKGMKSGPSEASPERWECSLADKVRFLSSPRSYTDRGDRVEVVETHMAVVFLTSRFAYKMKKPVHFPFLDFSTLEVRRLDCLEELRLNRRLAPEVYLDMVPLTLEGPRRLALAGGGEPVEWLVWMKRLPREGMLDRTIERDDVDEETLGPAAELLAAFYRDAPSRAPPVVPYQDLFRREIEEIGRDLVSPKFGLPEPLVRELAEGQTAFLDRRGSLLDERAEGGRIVEGHGDLRAEHVYLGPPPSVIDCLEFDRGLRTLDPVDDLGFLWLDCERLGWAAAGEYVMDGYCRVTGDRPPGELLGFYRSYRALLRARIAIRHLLDEDPGDPARWRGAALIWLALSRRHLPS